MAAVVNGTLVDLADPITSDSTLRIVTRDDPEALELIRHDAAHVLAEAVPVHGGLFIEAVVDDDT